MKQASLKVGETILIPNCMVANNFVTRFFGLMGKAGLANDKALLFPKCNSIHTFFMRFPIDVVLVTEDGRVFKIVQNLKPWRLLLPKKKVKHVIEMQGGLCEQIGLTAGMKLNMEGIWN